METLRRGLIPLPFHAGYSIENQRNLFLAKSARDLIRCYHLFLSSRTRPTYVLTIIYTQTLCFDSDWSLLALVPLYYRNEALSEKNNLPFFGQPDAWYPARMPRSYIQYFAHSHEILSPLYSHRVFAKVLPKATIRGTPLCFPAFTWNYSGWRIHIHTLSLSLTHTTHARALRKSIDIQIIYSQFFSSRFGRDLVCLFFFLFFFTLTRR